MIANDFFLFSDKIFGNLLSPVVCGSVCSSFVISLNIAEYRFHSVSMAYQYPTEPVGMPYTGIPYTTGNFGGYSLPQMSGLDHSQGKWFAPGEALPPGFIVTAHPEGHTAPLETHAMSDQARESFVITSGTAASAIKTGSSLKSKKSKKKKNSGWCC